MTTKGLFLASTAALVPLSNVLLLAALGVGGVLFAIHFVKEFGLPATSSDPTRCPTCQRDELLRIEASVRPSPIPLLHCRNCGEAYRWYGTSLIRDTGRPMF